MKRCLAVLGSLLKINSITLEGPDNKQPEDALFNLNQLTLPRILIWPNLKLGP